MNEFRMGLLKERADAIRPQLAEARQLAEKAETEGREMTTEERAIYDPVIKSAREIADGMAKVRDEDAVMTTLKSEFGDVMGGLGTSLTSSKSSRLSFKSMGAKVAAQMLPDGMKALAPLWRRRVGLTVKEYPMATLTYFTCKLHYMSVVRHEFDDTDADPEVKGINAGVTITAFIQQPSPKGDDVTPDEIQAGTLSPDMAMVVLAPVDCRLDNGELMLRADPDLDVDSFNSFAGFPATGLTTKLYRDRAAEKVYRWTGTAYVETTDYAPVRLVAQTPVLGLTADMTLCYRVDFDNVTYGGADQKLPSFAVAAPTSDIVLDLTTAPRVAF